MVSLTLSIPYIIMRPSAVPHNNSTLLSAHFNILSGYLVYILSIYYNDAVSHSSILLVPSIRATNAESFEN